MLVKTTPRQIDGTHGSSHSKHVDARPMAPGKMLRLPLALRGLHSSCCVQGRLQGTTDAMRTRQPHQAKCFAPRAADTTSPNYLRVIPHKRT